jgi:hypothetical protein
MSSPNIKLVLLIVLLLYLCGCAAKSSLPGKASTKIEPCSLITKQEAAAALGGDIEVTPTPEKNACVYGVVNATRNGSIVVIVVTSDSDEFQKFGVSRDAGTEAKPISGVGDRAVIFMSKERPNEGAKAIQALKGNVYVAIGMSTSTSPVSEDVLKSLAAKALSRLPVK